MKLPIQYALSYPNRLPSSFPRFDFFNYPNLTFEKPDTETFRNLAFAYTALEKGGSMPCILNAANEEAVSSFLKDEIDFLEMSDVIEKCMHQVTFVQKPTYEEYVATNNDARIKAKEIIADCKKKKYVV